MKKTHIVLILLLLLAAGGGVWIHNWMQRGMLVLGDPSWPAVRLAALDRIDFSGPDGSSFHAIANNGTWQIVSKSQSCRADTAKLSELLTAIASMPPAIHVGRYSAREARYFDLDKPQIGITLHGEKLEGGVWGIRLGKKGSDDSSVYARSSLQGDQVHLLDSQYVTLFSRPADYFYDLRVINALPADIVRIRADGPATGVWEISRKGDGFVFSAPEHLSRYEVASTKMELYLDALTSMRASCLKDTVPETLPPVQLTLSVWTKNADTPQTVEIFHSGNGAQQFLVRTTRQNRMVALDGARVDKLSVSAFSLRQRPVVEADLSNSVHQVLFIKSGTDDHAYRVDKLDKGWLETGSGVELTGFDMIMWRMSALQFVDKPREERPESAELALVWQFLNDAGESLAVVRFFTDSKLPAGRCWVNVQGESAWFPVKKEILDDVMSRLPAPPATVSTETDKG